MKVAIDVMGGDHAPKSVLDGVELALQQHPTVSFTLVGDENVISASLSSHERVQIIHTTETILSTDEPVRAVRRKKQASMVLMANEVKEQQADVCISAGNTGALMAAGLFVVGRIPGVERPALAPTLPTVDQKGVVLLDAGANVDATAEQLFQFATMGSIYAEKVRGRTQPRIGLLNIGSEENKGSALYKDAYALLKQSDLHFVGNIEARDVLTGTADVIVCDGFTGNIALKSVEGTAMTVFSMLKTALTSSVSAKLAAGVLKPKLKALKDQMDYSEYGGAALFGLKAPVIKAHGSSDATAIASAITQGVQMAEQRVIAQIHEQMKDEKSSS
ncbi:phosphate acyltransferase PlsX [Aureibacillus halotolerans]|uniref:Phosphate acyltransferase n=1 Tax=Aureibacillus halotolerans TaxID=1508390 RepID=A0A4V3D628_9BACI|nr:phosphate acyltransferase PlsX [Aureibacillus halotolerans]TDQ42387.1 phosphate:acyl-[acyl carrier protein] acyltransferase [Aureibacillus halotolerans]